jgi:enamine deaminase RidA (YjgF/YER057c/UK114 family)
MYITHADDWEEIGRAHGEIFSQVRPAATMIVVKELLNPRWRVEMEAEAVIP